MNEPTRAAVPPGWECRAAAQPAEAAARPWSCAQCPAQRQTDALSAARAELRADLQAIRRLLETMQPLGEAIATRAGRPPVNPT